MCNGYISTFDSAGMSFSTSETVSGVIQNNAVLCNVTVPYYWSVPSLNGNIGIGYFVSGQNSAGSVMKSVSGTLSSIPLSTTGTTAKAVNAAF